MDKEIDRAIEELKLITRSLEYLQGKGIYDPESEVVVPKEPTWGIVKEGMKASGFVAKADDVLESQCKETSETYKRIYKAMLQAAQEGGG